MSNNQKGLSKRKFKIPHSYIIIGSIILFMVILTYIVPAGEFDRVYDPVMEREVVDPDSFRYIENTPVSPFDMFKAIPKGMSAASDIIFFVFFAYGFVDLLIRTGAMDGGMAAVVRKMEGREKFIIPVLMLLFGIMGATFGMYEETYGLVGAVMAMTVALGYDAMVGAAVVFVGVGSGYAAAVTNPFSIGVAQGVAGIPIFSGMGFRIIVWIAFMTLSILYTMNYAEKVKKNPELSLVKDVDFPFLHTTSQDELLEKEFNTRHKISWVLFFGTIGLLVFGTLKFDWYLTELSALFLLMMFVVGLVNKENLSEIATGFVESAKTVMFGALVIGISRAVLIVLEDGQIIDTIVYALASRVANLSNYFAGIGMIFIQNILNFLIPSSSGQAATTMPIMVPIADFIGVNRQIAVLAFQFGDGFSNLFWPTVVSTACGIAGLPLDKWYKFMGKLFVLMLMLQVVFMTIAVAINFGP